MKIIRFVAENPNLIDLGKPVPVKNLIPDWYKKAESSFIENGQDMAGLKKCMPFMDTMVLGYFLTIPVDIYVTKDENNNPRFSWNGPESLSRFISERNKDLGATMPRPAGHYPNHLTFGGFWGWKTPRKWSTLVTQPLNRYDLPFTISSAVVDSDKFNASGNIPFFLKEGFEGTIPAGTPFAQLIPFKRSSWMMVDDSTGLRDMARIQGDLVRNNNDQTPYKKFAWQKKDFK